MLKLRFIADKIKYRNRNFYSVSDLGVNVYEANKISFSKKPIYLSPVMPDLFTHRLLSLQNTN